MAATRFVALLAIFVGLMMSGCGTEADGIWRSLHTEGEAPGERWHIQMAYVPGVDRVVLFGGDQGNNKVLNDTWSYDPGEGIWTELDPIGAPPARAGHGMAYDSTTGRVIMFGGYTYPKEGYGATSLDKEYLGDTWAYDPAANSWEELPPSDSGPGPRDNMGFVYDPVAGRIVMFGGLGGDQAPDGSTFGHTWAYNGLDNAWADVDPPGPSRRYEEAPP